MAKPKSYFVRIKPYNKKRGYLVRNYMHRGVRFTTRWKEVTAAVAAELELTVQPHDPDEEIPLFDVKTKGEAMEIEAEERDNADRPKLVSRVKDAERIPDRKFRDDRPKFHEDEVTDAAFTADQDSEIEAEPAPSLKPKSKSKGRRARSRS
jgi:hypothetical protein